MPTAQRTAAAKQDLERIAFEIAVGSRRPATADLIIEELVQQCDRLAQFAKTAVLGTAAPEIGEGVRLFPYKRWVILFRYSADGIVVLRIADGKQDYLSWQLA